MNDFLSASPYLTANTCVLNIFDYLSKLDVMQKFITAEAKKEDKSTARTSKAFSA